MSGVNGHLGRPIGQCVAHPQRLQRGGGICDRRAAGPRPGDATTDGCKQHSGEAQAGEAHVCGGDFETYPAPRRGQRPGVGYASVQHQRQQVRAPIDPDFLRLLALGAEPRQLELLRRVLRVDEDPHNESVNS